METIEVYECAVSNTKLFNPMGKYLFASLECEGCEHRNCCIQIKRSIEEEANK